MRASKAIAMAANSRLCVTSGVLLALLAGDAALRSGYAQKDVAPIVVAAQEFRVLDMAGKTRATLGVQAHGTPGLSLIDADGHVRATMRIRDDGTAGISLHDPDGKERVGLDEQTDGSASLTLTNRQGKGGAAFVIRPDGNPVGIFRDKTGLTTWAAPEPNIPAVDKGH